MPKYHNQQTDWLLKAMELAFAKGKGLWAHSLLDALDGLTAAQATWKPRGKGARSIWEIVHHVTYWKGFLIQRLDGETKSFSDEESWAVQGKPTAAEWAKTVARLKNRHAALLKRLRTQQLDLNRPLPRGKARMGAMLFGVLAHDLYHTGRIMALRELQGVD